MPRLPFASREDLLEELAEIAAERAQMGRNPVCPERAAEQRETLDRWEHDLEEQLQEMGAAR